MILVFDCAKRLSTVLLIGSILAFSNAARAAEANPLRPVDTASPERHCRISPPVCRRVRGWDLEFESGLLQRRIIQT